jgi:plasminogen activator inhibitor 1 RNA-binding protein
MDRHSATGKTDSDKKIHQTWGGDDGPTELKAEEAAVVDAAVAATDNTWGVEAAPADDPWATPAVAPGDEAAPAPAAAEGERPARRGGDRDAREPEEEDNTVSYDQYLAQKAAEESALPTLAPRSANEGVDESQWKDTVEVTKAEEDAYFAPKAKNAPKQKAKKEEKVYIEIDARFERPRGGGDRGRGGDRGARGGGRGRGDNGGGRGRGGGDRGPRGGRGPAGVDVADEKAFPSLS